MREVAILLLVALVLNGCGGNTTPTQTAAGGTWQAALSGGESSASGLSFITQFTVGGNNTLSVSYFQFLNQSEAQPPCFPITGATVAGTMTLTENQTTFTVTGPIVLTVQSGSNTLTLTGNVTGTENGLNGTTLSGATATGNWTLAGGTGCNDPAGGSFTMTQS
jgi:hypothetical protein